MDEIMRVFACCRSTVKDNVDRAGLPRRPRGWKPVGYNEQMSGVMRQRSEARRR